MLTSCSAYFHYTQTSKKQFQHLGPFLQVFLGCETTSQYGQHFLLYPVNFHSHHAHIHLVREVNAMPGQGKKGA